MLSPKRGRTFLISRLIEQDARSFDRIIAGRAVENAFV